MLNKFKFLWCEKGQTFIVNLYFLVSFNYCHCHTMPRTALNETLVVTHSICHIERWREHQKHKKQATETTVFVQHCIFLHGFIGNVISIPKNNFGIYLILLKDFHVNSAAVEIVDDLTFSKIIIRLCNFISTWLFKAI